MSNKEKTYIAIVLDESGSMRSALRETIDGFNEQIQTIKANQTPDIDTMVTLITFNSGINTQYINVPADQVQELDTLTYKPNGTTALYDAMGEAIAIIEASPDFAAETTSVLMVVISDGDENASVSYTSQEIKEKLETYQDESNWTVTYMGANANVAAVANTIGVHAGNTSVFSAASASGYSDAYTTVSKGLDSFMKTRSMAVTLSADGSLEAATAMRKAGNFYSATTDSTTS
jgi:uncharacterized protein YegL